MAPFYQLFVRRSDGKLQTKTSSKLTLEHNEPTPDQLDTKPNAKGICDYYRECQPGNAKELDWRRKLGGMLMRECNPQQAQHKNYILAWLPENYRLYEHIKCKVNTDGLPLDSGKNHAAGANERQDAYLYGYPDGRRKRYRSPAEFFPHLLWLATDPTGDPGNCSCRFCSPEELEDDKTKAKELKEASKKAASPAPVAIKNEPGQIKAAPKAPILSHATIPRPQAKEQKLDLQPDVFFMRNGEIVWFARSNAWGLGVIVDRKKGAEGVASALYKVQPLSHPFDHPEAKWLQHHNLRPWLAWSAPPPTNAGLQDPKLTYDRIDWRAVLANRYGNGDPEVDGSILAVRAAETTYTLLETLPRDASWLAGETRYAGAYIGGEKVWVGDALRVRVSNRSNDILILHSIIEKPNPADESRPTLTLAGDLYSYEVNLGRDPQPKELLHLPARVRQDLEFRNHITKTAKDSPRQHYWKLFGRRHLLLSEVKGRWYETRLLAPLLNNESFQHGLKQGISVDATIHMNGQGDCNKPGGKGDPVPASIKKDRRREAFSAAVPPGEWCPSSQDAIPMQHGELTLSGFRISLGADEVKPESNVQPPPPPPPSSTMPAARTTTPIQRTPSTSQPQQQRPPSASPYPSHPYTAATSSYPSSGYPAYAQTQAYPTPAQPYTAPPRASPHPHPHPQHSFSGYPAQQAYAHSTPSSQQSYPPSQQPQQPPPQSSLFPDQSFDHFLGLDPPDPAAGSTDPADLMDGFTWDGGAVSSFYGGQR